MTPSGQDWLLGSLQSFAYVIIIAQHRLKTPLETSNGYLCQTVVFP